MACRDGRSAPAPFLHAVHQSGRVPRGLAPTWSTQAMIFRLLICKSSPPFAAVAGWMRFDFLAIFHVSRVGASTARATPGPLSWLSRVSSGAASILRGRVAKMTRENDRSRSIPPRRRGSHRCAFEAVSASKLKSEIKFFLLHTGNRRVGLQGVRTKPRLYLCENSRNVRTFQNTLHQLCGASLSRALKLIALVV